VLIFNKKREALLVSHCQILSFEICLTKYDKQLDSHDKTNFIENKFLCNLNTLQRCINARMSQWEECSNFKCWELRIEDVSCSTYGMKQMEGKDLSHTQYFM